MFKNISQKNNKLYEITKPGEYIFYFENKNGNITFDIKCENANVKIYGLYQGNAKDDFKLNIMQIHTEPNSKSEVIIKSVLSDYSKLDFTGTIRITEYASNTVAHLTNKNLLLSKNSNVITSPQLEVIPNEVECTHSASTTLLDKKQLDYLMARGITKNNSQKLLIDGFIEDITQHKKL